MASLIQGSGITEVLEVKGRIVFNDQRLCWQRRRRTFFRTKDLVLGSILILIVLLFAALAPVIAPSPTKQDLAARLGPPLWCGAQSHGHLLGTDPLGRDLFSRILWGSHVSLLVGFIAVVIAGGIGVPIGIIAGLYGGWLDTVLMRIADIQLAFPDILLALAIISVTGPSLLNIILSIVICTWVRYARVARGSTLVVRETAYVEAARALGASSFRILARHVLPNIATPIIILGTLQVGRAIITESALSFLGLGIPPPTPSWGSMLAEGREYLMIAWWIAMFPGIAILVAVLGVNLIGNGLRLVLDPKLKV